MFGKNLGEYLRLQIWVLVAIVVVFALRWALSAAGVAAAPWASVTGLLLIGSLYYGIVVHTRGFGSYKQLYPLNLFQSLVAESLVALAIVIGILTGLDNIYTAPEFSGGQDGKNWFHAFAHFVIVGMVVLPLLGWLVSSIVMFVTKKVAPRST